MGSTTKISAGGRACSLKWGILQRYLQEGVFPEVGNTTKISAGGRACSLVLTLVTTPHFIDITREKRVSQGGGLRMSFVRLYTAVNLVHSNPSNCANT